MEDKIETPEDKLLNARNKFEDAKNNLVEATTDIISIGGFSKESINEMKTTIGDLTLTVALMDGAMGIAKEMTEKPEEKKQTKIGF